MATPSSRPAPGILRALIILLPLLGTVRSADAQVGPWTAHTSLRDARSVGASATHIWVGTTGGLFALDIGTETLAEYTVVDGLHAVSAENIAVDNRRSVVWVGYDDGVLDRLDPETGVIRTFRDIQRATQFPSRRINRLKLSGDTLYVATDFGLVVFDAAQAEVRDAYTRFGSFSAAIPVYDFDFGLLDNGGPAIWVATEEGVASADRGFVNLQDPSVWEAEGLPTLGPIRALASFGDSLYIGLDDGLRVRVAASDYRSRGPIARQVRGFLPVQDRLLGISEFRVFQVDSSRLVTNVSLAGLAFPNAVTIGPNGRMWVADMEAGLGRVELGASNATSMEVSGLFFPEGPRDGLFSSVSVGDDGSLLFGGVSGAGRGFYHLKADATWTNYYAGAFPEMGSRASFFTVNIADDGALWAGSTGGGVVHVAPEGSIIRYSEVNSSLLPVSGLSDFILVGGLDEDRDRATWVTTLGSPAPLHVRSASGEWTPLAPYVGDGLTNLSNAYGPLFIDSFDQKWIIIRDESSFSNTRGLMILDTGRDAADRSDDAFRFFRSVGGIGQGLPSTNVTAVVEDRNGLVWIGTDRGLAYTVNTGFAAQDDNTVLVWPQQADRTEGPYLFFGLPITSLAVDPANRLWVGTNEGVRIVESAEGGFREVGSAITTENAPLPSNVIVALVVEPASGNVFVVTDAGMVSLQGEAIEPVVEIADLFVYPNPADFTTGDPEIFIEGLAESSTVTIVSPSGARIRRMDARGGRIRWDGRDESGSEVPSGVYVVVAVGLNGEGTGYGKVAVVR